MSRLQFWTAVAALLGLVGPALAGGEPGAGERLRGKWTVPGGDTWEVHADGTVTGTFLGQPLFLKDRARETGSWLTYQIGKEDRDGAEVTLRVRVVAPDKSALEGTFRARIAFTKKGRLLVRYTEKPANADRLPLPLPEDKKLFRPEELDD